jgi:hypothetical protein
MNKNYNWKKDASDKSYFDAYGKEIKKTEVDKQPINKIDPKKKSAKKIDLKKEEEKSDMTDKIKWGDVVFDVHPDKNLSHGWYKNLKNKIEEKTFLMLYELNRQHVAEYHTPIKYKDLFKKLTAIDKDLIYEYATKVANGSNMSLQKDLAACPTSSTTCKSSTTSQSSTSISSTLSPSHPPTQKEYIEELKILLNQYLNVHTLSKCDLCGEIHIPCTCNLCKLTHVTLNKTYKSGR